MAFLERVVTPCWPVIILNSFEQDSNNLEFCDASPKPRLITIFFNSGT
jgi:hypothetical protein